MAPRTMNELKELLNERNIDYKAHPAWSTIEQLAALAPEAAIAAQLKILRELAQEDKAEINHIATFLADDKNAGAIAQAKRAYEKAVGLVTAYNQANGSRLLVDVREGGLELVEKKRAQRENVGRSYVKLYEILLSKGIESVLYFSAGKSTTTLTLLSNGKVRYNGVEKGITDVTSTIIKEQTDRTTFTVNAWNACYILDGGVRFAIGDYYDRNVDAEGNIIKP